MDLSNLTDEQLVELQAEIEETKKQRAQKEEAAQRKHILDTHGVKIVCPTCEGTGESYPSYWEPGDPPDNCRTCDSYGYIWAPKYGAGKRGDEGFEKFGEVFGSWKYLGLG